MTVFASPSVGITLIENLSIQFHENTSNTWVISSFCIENFTGGMLQHCLVMYSKLAVLHCSKISNITVFPQYIALSSTLIKPK